VKHTTKHAKHGAARGSEGMPPQENILKIGIWEIESGALSN